jgi:hypothetical protein
MESNIQATETAPVETVTEQTEAPQAPETQATETPPAEEKKLLSPQLAALAKKEKAILKRELEAKTLQGQLQKEREEFAKRMAEFEETMKNPWKLLERSGYSYEDLVNMKLNEGNPTPDIEIRNVKSEIQKLREEQELEKKKLKEDQERLARAEEEKQIKLFKDNLKTIVSKDSDKFELVNLYGAYETVFQTIEAHFEQTQEVMDIETAANLVEKYLEAEAEKVLKAKKISQKIAPPKAQETKEEVKAQPKTLTNDMTSTIPLSMPASSEEDRIKRALAALSK